MGGEFGISRVFESMGGGAGALLTGESPAAKKSREFLARLLALVIETPALKEEFVEALKALKNANDEIWKDTSLADKLAMSAALGTFLAMVKK